LWVFCVLSVESVAAARSEKREDALALAALCRKKAERLRKDGWLYASARERIARELARAEALERDPDQGVPVLPGLHERAYFSPVDGSAQPWIYYLPRSSEGPPSEGWPCIVFLHGYAPRLHEGNWLDLMIPDELFQMAEEIGWAAVLPFGRGNVDYLGVGERDVMDVLDRAIECLELDPQRVVLGGISMGGAGVWCIASHTPDRFAGVMPMAGRSDFFLWKQDPIHRARLDRRTLADLDYLWARRENVVGLPAFLVHSKDDHLIRPEQSTRIHADLTARGSPSRLVLYEREGHWVASRAFEEEDARDWLRKLPRRSRPSEGALSALSPDYGKAFGVSIERIERWTDKAEVHWKEEGKGIRFRVQNVAELSVDLDEFLPGHREPALTFFPKPDVTWRTGSETRAVWGDRPRRLCKRPGLCGPVRQATSEPFLAVYGEGESESLCERFAQAWEAFAHGRMRTKRDSEVVAEDLEAYHLVLFGEAGENLWVERVREGLPISWMKGSCLVGERRFQGEGLGLSLVYPSPLNDGKLVVWNAGEIWGLGMESNHLMDFLPDFAVFTSDLERDGSNRVLCSGFFDAEWKLDPSLMFVNEKIDDGADP